MPLERELATFHVKLPELLATAAGQYVLIHGDEVAGVYGTWGEASDAGYERFGLDAVLVKQIVEHEEPIVVSRDVH
jgi:hypothetical protein